MGEEEKEELGDAIKEFNRGVDTHIEGKLDDALKHFQAALPTFQEFGVEDMIAGIFHEMGMLLQEKGESDGALDYYQRSLQFSEKLKYKPGCAKTYFQMGTLYETRGDIITAEEYYQKSKACKTYKPLGLKFIIVLFILSGLNLLILGYWSAIGILENFRPILIDRSLWGAIIALLSIYGPLFCIIAFISAAGLYLLKGWGWVMGILTSILSFIFIVGIISYWYLSNNTIQELYDVK